MGKTQIHNIILNFPALDFLVQKIKEWEIQNSFCRSLPYFSIYPAVDHMMMNFFSNMLESYYLFVYRLGTYIVKM